MTLVTRYSAPGFLKEEYLRQAHDDRGCLQLVGKCNFERAVLVAGVVRPPPRNRAGAGAVARGTPSVAHDGKTFAIRFLHSRTGPANSHVAQHHPGRHGVTILQALLIVYFIRESLTNTDTIFNINTNTNSNTR